MAVAASRKWGMVSSHMPHWSGGPCIPTTDSRLRGGDGGGAEGCLQEGGWGIRGVFSSTLCAVAAVLVPTARMSWNRLQKTDRHTRQNGVALSLTYGERVCWGA